MEKMSSTTAAGVFFLGWVAFLGLAAFALWGPLSGKVTPPETANKFFSKAQFGILFGKSPYDPQNPKQPINLSASQVGQLSKWGFASCVQSDGTTAQSSSDSACFCENSPAVRAIFASGTTVQPQNTWSAFGLGLIGIVILGFLVFSDVPQQQNFMTVAYFFALCYAGLTIALGPLSMMLHAGLQKWGEFGDDLSLYLWFSFVACYAFFKLIYRVGGWSPESPSWLAIGLFLLSWAVLLCIPAILTAPIKQGGGSVMSSTPWYGILGGAALLGELLLWIGNQVGDFRAPATAFTQPGADHWYSNLGPSSLFAGNWDTGGRTWFLAGGCTFALALGIWILSWSRKPLCFPKGPQGHAIFHLLSGVAAACLYKYYRHEGEVA